MSIHYSGAGVIPSGYGNLRERNLGDDSQSNRYEKREKIRDSLYGRIYLGLDTVTNQKVIIKSSWRTLALAQQLRDGSSSAEDIMEEIRVLERLSNDPDPCPYIIKLLDVQYKHNSIDMILERAEGGDLFKYMKDKNTRLKIELDGLRGTPEYTELLHEHWDEVLKIMKQILRATAYLHSRNICHRDLSSENIVLDSDRNIRLIDFGNVKEYVDGDWLSEKGKIGKSVYMSRECYANENYDGRDNDMWCNGVILFQMLLGSTLWTVQDNSDPRFRVFSEYGLAGLERILEASRCSDRLPPYCSDFLLKIFCPQKCRMTVWDALVHPYITSGAMKEDFHPRRVPIQLPAEPDPQLERLAHFTRYNRVETPSAWIELSQEKRQRVIKLLSRINGERKLLALDLRVLKRISWEENIKLDDVRLIVHYLWAASEHPNRVSFFEEQKECHHDYHTSKPDRESRKRDVEISEDCKSIIDVSETDNFDSDISILDGSSSESECSLKVVDIKEDRKVDFKNNIGKMQTGDLSLKVPEQKRDSKVREKATSDLWPAHGRAGELTSRRFFRTPGVERPSNLGRAKKSIKNVRTQKVGWARWNTSRGDALEFIPESGVPAVNTRFRALSEGKIYAKKCHRTAVVGRPRGRSAICKRKRQLQTKCFHRDMEEKSNNSTLAVGESKLDFNGLGVSPELNGNSSKISGSAFRGIPKKRARAQSYECKTLNRITSYRERPSRRGRTLSEGDDGRDREPEQIRGNLIEPTSSCCIQNLAQTPRPAARRENSSSDEPTFCFFQKSKKTPRPGVRRGDAIASIVVSAIV